MTESNARLLKLILLLSMFIWTSPHARGQLRATIHAGMTGSTFVGDTSADRSPVVRLSGGGGFRYLTTTGFELETGVVYTVKGSGFEGDIDGVAIEAVSETSYLEVPLLVGYRFNPYGTWAPRIFAGPSVGFKIDSTIRYNAVGSDFEQSERDDSVRSQDLGLMVGVDVNRIFGGETLSFGLRGTYGISNVRIKDPAFHNVAMGMFIGLVF